MIETSATVISNKKAAKDQYEMVLEIKGRLPAVNPGQFCMVSVNDASRLLRRPFSVFRVLGKNKFSILYKLAGEGTESLARCCKGTVLSALLPLGNGFDIKGSSKDVVYLVAGGIGVASVFSLMDMSSKKTKFFYGARTASELIPVKKTKNSSLFLSTDDGTKGKRGFITDSVINELKKDLDSADGKKIHVMSCGPHVMLEQLYKGIRIIDKNVKLSFCFEEHMACGVGVCMGCVVQSKDGYRRSCTDGPVMDADTIVW
jgi:dihydroorotate dehydrogenase electron transfer subunit